MSQVSQPNQDWFVSAILKDGTVAHCLAEVVKELKRKEQFIAVLSSRISERAGATMDAVSEISARIGILENTVKFRLSILNPDRRGAWFRTSATTSTGPFSGTIMTDPVFPNFDESRAMEIRKGLVECWQKRNLIGFPLKATEPSVWKTLLTLNFEVWNLGDLGEWPRLETLPESLPADLDSRSLRAFLANVNTEYIAARERLNKVFDMLLAASDKFFAKCSVSSGVRSSDKSSGQSQDKYDGYAAAENVRESFRKRRATPTIRRPVGKSAQDLEALRFMGFEDFPSEEDLKHRYHRLAMEMHPDRQGGNESRFKLLAKSYKHLRRLCAP
jgi:hypothetical protein